MARATTKRNSIYAQLVWLLTVSFLASVLVFFCLDFVGENAIDGYYNSRKYRQREKETHLQYIDDLQEFVSENNLSTSDTEELNEWVKEQKMVAIRIFKDDVQVFDSLYPEEKTYNEEISASLYRWEEYYTVSFSDGAAEVSILSAYMYQLYNYVVYASMILSFAFFLVLVLLGIRHKMKYIRQLSCEIEILEGGSLDYPVTVRGKDELAALAEGLENMRLSVRSMIERETRMVSENRRIVTEMSHDLRTPVTSIMLYTEILKKGNYFTDDKASEYVERIDKKARRMKQLTDHLFEYSLVSGAEDVKLEDREFCEVLFYDLFSETCSYLKQKGFSIEFDVLWPEKQVRISTDYVMRIMDNITSNIIKYADAGKPVIIRSDLREGMCGFTFENTIRVPDKNVESTGIGVQNIDNMMKKMGGVCINRVSDGKFSISIYFPVCDG